VIFAPLAYAGTTVFAPAPLAGHPVVEVRAGVAADAGDAAAPHPYLCAEVTPLVWLSVEGCGTGQGFLYPSTGPDVAHFRARGHVARLRRGRLELEGIVGAGLAEAERGPDRPGFVLSGDDPVETAGPEGVAAGVLRLWLSRRTYAILDVTAGAAWMPGAPEVLGTGSEWVPVGAVTVGAGF
jgi:hypothetical protein